MLYYYNGESGNFWCAVHYNASKEGGGESTIRPIISASDADLGFALECCRCVSFTQVFSSFKSGVKIVTIAKLRDIDVSKIQDSGRLVVPKDLEVYYEEGIFTIVYNGGPFIHSTLLGAVDFVNGYRNQFNI